MVFSVGAQPPRGVRLEQRKVDPPERTQQAGSQGDTLSWLRCPWTHPRRHPAGGGSQSGSHIRITQGVFTDPAPRLHPRPRGSEKSIGFVGVFALSPSQ